MLREAEGPLTAGVLGAAIPSIRLTVCRTNNMSLVIGPQIYGHVSSNLVLDLQYFNESMFREAEGRLIAGVWGGCSCVGLLVRHRLSDRLSVRLSVCPTVNPSVRQSV